jgi:hypothetical protein
MVSFSCEVRNLAVVPFFQKASGCLLVDHYSSVPCTPSTPSSSFFSTQYCQSSPYNDLQTPPCLLRAPQYTPEPAIFPDITHAFPHTTTTEQGPLPHSHTPPPLVLRHTRPSLRLAVVDAHYIFPTLPFPLPLSTIPVIPSSPVATSLCYLLSISSQRRPLGTTGQSNSPT